jgi:hypothetical protein
VFADIIWDVFTKLICILQAVMVLGRPVDDVGNLPEISPSVMRGLEIMQLNISKLTKAWKEQQQRHSSRKSITAGPSNRK